MSAADCGRIQGIGYVYISLDLEGYRTGSMNAVLEEKETAPRQSHRRPLYNNSALRSEHEVLIVGVVAGSTPWSGRSPEPRVTQNLCSAGNAGMAQLAECVPIKGRGHCRSRRVRELEGRRPDHRRAEGPLSMVLWTSSEGGASCLRAGKERGRDRGEQGLYQDLMRKYISLGRYGTFTDRAEAEVYIRSKGAPLS